MDHNGSDLLLLQERCRKDPASYREEFISQRRHFDALLAATTLRPSDPSPRLAAVASFMGAVAHCYGDDGQSVAPTIITLLTDSGPTMHPELRRSLVRLLALLRARNAADPVDVIPLFFRLLACNDKILRRMLHGHIVSDIKKLHAVGHSSRRKLQSFLFSMVADPSEVLVKRSLHVLVDLFRKKIWNDAKCTNMIANACFHPATPVAIIAARFILDSESKDRDEVESEDEEEEDDEPNTAVRGRDGQKAAEMWKTYNMTGKKTSKKRKRMERVIKRLTKSKTTSTTSAVSEENPSHPSFEAMMLLNDPQDLAERLFSDLQTRRRKEPYETRLIFINLISRLVGTHQLILFNFYPFLQRYLHPSQTEVTRVLAYLTQACHDLVPSDVLHPILRGLADTFVSERSSPPSMAAGINTIRAICSRVPLAILDAENEDLPKDKQRAPLLEDLVQYRSSKDKGVTMASRSLVALYREVHPRLLHKKDRGRAGAVAVQKGHESIVRSYGEHRFATGVDGIELLNEPSDDDDSDGDDSEFGEADKIDDNDATQETKDPASLETSETGEGEKEVSEHKKDSAEPEDESESDADADIENDETSEPDDEKEHVEDLQNEDAEHDQGGDGLAVVRQDKKKHQEKDKGEEESEKRIDEMNLLTNEDFAKIRARQAAKALGLSSVTKNTGDAVNPDELQGPIKREKPNLQERLKSVLEGREGREKFGSRRGLNKGGGSTNQKKLKGKSNSMVIHKRRKGSKMSRRDRQLKKRTKRDYR